MQTRFPQGNAIITAEFSPDIGESGTARYFTLELKDDSVDLDTLSHFQALASKGVFQSCMFAYTEWLKKFLLSEEAENEFITVLDGGFVKRRDDFIKRLTAENKKCHARIPEVVAWMDIGFSMLTKFLQSNKIVTDEKSAELQTQFLDILFSLAVKQSESIEQDKPTRKYIEKLFALIESGQVSFLKKDLANDFKPPNFVGYEDDRFYYIVSDLAHKHVKKLCDDIGESFSVQAKPLIKMLAEEGLLDVGSKNTKQIWFGNSKQRVMCLFKDKAKAYVGME